MTGRTILNRCTAAFLLLELERACAIIASMNFKNSYVHIPHVSSCWQAPVFVPAGAWVGFVGQCGKKYLIFI